ncbi:hypothetical protein D3C72_1261850 [compost metagenome]
MLQIKVEHRRFHHRPQAAKVLQRRLLLRQQAGLHGQMAAPVAQPPDARALKIALQAVYRKGTGGPLARQRGAGVGACHHLHLQGQIGHIAGHGAVGAVLLQKQLLSRAIRHCPQRWPKAIHVVEGSRRAQRTHHVRAIGKRQHMQGGGDCRPARAAPGRARRRPGVACGAVHRVVGMPAQAKLGRIGASHKHGAAGTHALEVDGIGLGHLACKQW